MAREKLEIVHYICSWYKRLVHSVVNCIWFLIQKKTVGPIKKTSFRWVEIAKHVSTENVRELKFQRERSPWRRSYSCGIHVCLLIAPWNIMGKIVSFRGLVNFHCINVFMYEMKAQAGVFSNFWKYIFEIQKKNNCKLKTRTQIRSVCIPIKIKKFRTQRWMFQLLTAPRKRQKAWSCKKIQSHFVRSFMFAVLSEKPTERVLA